MKFRVVFLLAGFFAFAVCKANPITDLCSRKHIDQKAIIIAISLEHCSSCITPPSTLLKEIRKVDPYIPVFIVTKDTLTETETFFLRKLFSDSLQSIRFLCDGPTYDYMMLKKKGIPSVCCVSQHKVLTFNHLKYESLAGLYKAITPNFEVRLLEKVALQNKILSTQKYSNVVQNGNYFYTFHSGVKLVSEYNAAGENIRNLFLDSLKIDYLEVVTQLFTKKEQKYSRPYYSSAKHRSRLFKPVGLFRSGKDTLCVSAYFTCYGDTILPESILKTKEQQKLKNKKVSYEQKYACLLLFDTSLTYLGMRSFRPYDEPISVDLYSSAAHAGSQYYLGRFDAPGNQFAMAEYIFQDSKLTRAQQFIMPPEEDRTASFTITGTDKGSLFVLYPKIKKNKLSSVKVYRFNKGDITFTKELEIGMAIRNVHETPKGNLILLVSRDERSAIKGYNKNKRAVIESSEQSAASMQKGNVGFFIFDGFIQRYVFTE